MYSFKWIKKYFDSNYYYKVNVSVEKGNIKDSRYSNFQKNEPYGEIVHDEGFATSKTALQRRETWNSGTYATSKARAGIHGWVEWSTGNFLQTAPFNYRMPHVGSTGSLSDYYIGIEIMDSPYVIWNKNSTKIIGFTDKAKAKECIMRAYVSRVEIAAVNEILYGYSNKKKPSRISKAKTFLGHYEGANIGLATSHSDPKELFNVIGKTMTIFRSDVETRVKELKNGADCYFGETLPDEYKKLLPCYNKKQSSDNANTKESARYYTCRTANVVDDNGEVVTEFKSGTAVNYLGESKIDGEHTMWMISKPSANIRGWIDASRLKGVIVYDKRFIVNVDDGDTLAIRENPSSFSKKLAGIPNEKQIKYLGKKDGIWYKVSTTINGTKYIGWVSSKYLVEYVEK